jgi:uncharacterized surface protein with fasciclin (FAS1) repeats
MQAFRKQHPRVGRDVVGALTAGGKYSTFLSLAKRAGLLPLLQGTAPDTMFARVDFVEGAISTPQTSTANMKITGNLPANVNVTDLKSKIADMLNDVQSDAVKNTIAEEGQITVFAPTNAAFSKLPKATFDSLQSDSIKLVTFLRAHIVNRGVYTQGMSAIHAMQTLAGNMLTVGTTSTGAHSVNKVAIVEHDLSADNGVVQGIDSVLPPSDGPEADGSADAQRDSTQ